MTHDSITTVLAQFPVLEPLDTQDRRALAGWLEPVDVAPGQLVFEQGDEDRDFYFVLSGQGKVLQNHVELGTLGPGDHFGELGLLAGNLHSTSITTSTGMELLRLSFDRWQELTEQAPALALRFVRGVVGKLQVRLRAFTDSVGDLVQDRSAARPTHCTVTVEGRPRRVGTGTPLAELLPETVDGRPVMVAKIDHRFAMLGSPITSDCTLEPVTTAHWEGQRILGHSAALLLQEAAWELDSRVDILLGGNIGAGRRIAFSDTAGRPVHELVSELNEVMRAIVQQDRPLNDEWWTVEEALAHFRILGWKGTQQLLDTTRWSTARMLSYGELYVLGLDLLAPRTGLLGSARVAHVRDQLMLLWSDDETAARGGEGLSVTARLEAVHTVAQRHDALAEPYERWLGALGVNEVGDFNRACIRGDVSELIRVAEGFQEKRISEIADQVRDAPGRVRVITVAGPSSSGKTTFNSRLKVQLEVNGIHPVPLSLDNWFVNNADTPLDREGKPDFESFDALRRDLLADQVGRLLRGDRVRTARFDFKTGISHPEGGREVKLRDDQVLMLEGIHGLNRRLLEGIPVDATFRVFIHPMQQIPFDRLWRLHASDLRLLRRIVRDRFGRHIRADENILRWPSVRRGERLHIFPYQHHADAVFDSSLVYEPSVLKVFAERYLLEVPRDSPAFATAHRLLKLLQHFVAIYPDHVPPTSLLREFVGGSSFEHR